MSNKMLTLSACPLDLASECPLNREGKAALVGAFAVQPAGSRSALVQRLLP